MSLVFKPGVGVRLLVGEAGAQFPLETTINSMDGTQLLLTLRNPPDMDLALLLENRHLRAMVCRQDAAYSFEGHTGALSVDGTVLRLRYTVTGEPLRHQRRSSYRVERSMPAELWLPLENRAFFELGGTPLIREYWVRGVTHNLGAGGLKLKLALPEGHVLPGHHEARITLEVTDGRDAVSLEERKLHFLRIEGAPEAGVLVYAFADLLEDERNRLHKLIIRFEQEMIRRSLKDAAP